ncbi:uncharacterized protein I303_102568 [Kwoniella dejecticola CBS 10117]|uniref:Dienelactone hydrolase domain-containing protein n=1 Tax=Kwoniella dejecticola CBS 10117 TaxID=1296121 RepID=A0A1A6A940_9TREE|nr:uncharacterized protein I303_02582 [Kwoniella dejecticola CBS 10117]OBR86574.1 hypothetical protein I303_02582 [Kwoniella dejecticola CBS 10117]
MSGDCCKLPPVQAEYSPKGSYPTIHGLKTYAVGPEDAKVAVVMVYDVFGYSPQILQGADLIASQGYRVLMPDFLVGDYATPALFAPGNEEKKTAWFGRFPGGIQTQLEPVAKYVQATKSTYSKVATIGYCWGYKVAVGAQAEAKSDAIVGCHPSFAAKEDADKIDVPVALLPSGGEDMEVINHISKTVEAKVPGKNILKHYPDMPHGWLAARGDLKGGKATEQFADGYDVVVKFLKDTF